MRSVWSRVATDSRTVVATLGPQRRPAGWPTSPARTAPASRSRSPGAGCDRSRSGEAGCRRRVPGVRAHRPQRFDDTSHRTASQRSIAVQGGASSAARRASPRAAAGSSRSCRSRAPRRGAVRPSAPGRDDPVVDGPRRRRACRSTVAPRAPTIAGRRTHVGAVARARDLALAGGEGRQDQRPMADRLVAGQAQLTAQPRRPGGPRRRSVGRAGVTVPLNACSARRRRPSRAPTEVAVQAADVLVDRHEGGHQVAELVEVELLLGVGQGVVRASGGPRP